MHFTQSRAVGEPPEGAESEMDFTSVETDCRKPETYCPWNWPCPHLSNDLVDLKKVELIELKASKQACPVGTDLINPMPRRPRDDSSDAREDTQENNPVLGACTPRRVRGEVDASSPAFPGNGDAIQYWLSRQPWGPSRAGPAKRRSPKGNYDQCSLNCASGAGGISSSLKPCASVAKGS